MAESQSWLSRLKAGLSRSTTKISEGLTGLVTKRRLDNTVLEELEETLIAADLGPVTASKIVSAFGREKFGKDVSDDEVREALASHMAEILSPCAIPLTIPPVDKPYVIMMVGVNGAGKTTTIGKLAKQYVDMGLKVSIAACDTFRAAAVSQLQVWGERVGCEVLAAAENSDSAALAYQALVKAQADKVDVLFIDTAGRLQNKTGLMEELSKMRRVLKKLDPDAPQSTLLVLDATTGQNAHTQVEVFTEMTSVSGLILTKLDGSAKGGIVVALADRFKMPIHAVGVGETIDDLHAFDAATFARSLMGLAV